LRIVKLRKSNEALSLRCIVGVVAAVLPFAASASPETLASSGPIAIDGANGAVISRMGITSTSGSCFTIGNSTNVTIAKSEIGPCGDPDDAKTFANVWNQPAYEQLYPMSATNPPPAIPVRPNNRVAVSSYPTSKSLPSFDPPRAASSTSPPS
jgi:hypothetical protein